MSYARFGPESDIYVIYTINDVYCCVGCLMEPDEDAMGWETQNAKTMYTHLIRHTLKNHKVPKHALERFKAEILNGTK